MSTAVTQNENLIRIACFLRNLAQALHISGMPAHATWNST
jgi:hypothetical protein